MLDKLMQLMLRNPGLVRAAVIGGVLGLLDAVEVSARRAQAARSDADRAASEALGG